MFERWTFCHFVAVRNGGQQGTNLILQCKQDILNGSFLRRNETIVSVHYSNIIFDTINFVLGSRGEGGSIVAYTSNGKKSTKTISNPFLILDCDDRTLSCEENKKLDQMKSPDDRILWPCSSSGIRIISSSARKSVVPKSSVPVTKPAQFLILLNNKPNEWQYIQWVCGDCIYNCKTILTDSDDGR